MSAFDKIIGYEKEVEDLRMLCDVMRHKEKYEAMGIHLPQTLLLVGEPGTGKTLMANALIAECGRACFSCRKDRSDGEFVDRITEVFRQAAAAAPSVIFFDDMDRFAEDNLSENSNKEEFITIQTGLEGIREKDVFVVATANNLRNLPDSLLRAGRFGRQIRVDAPSQQDAVKIIRSVLSGKKMETDVRAEDMACLLNGQSCAVLETVIHEAGLLAAYENREKIARADMVKAFLRIKFGGLPKEDERAPELRSRIAYHEAGHAVMSLALHRRVDVVTICRFGDAGGFCLGEDREEMHDCRQIGERIAIMLAGHAAVRIRFGETDLGSKDDILRSMDVQSEMLELCGVENYRYGYWNREYHEKQAPRALDREVRKVRLTMARYERKARDILRRNRKLLDAIAEALLQKELLLKEDIDQICREIA